MITNFPFKMPTTPSPVLPSSLPSGTIPTASLELAPITYSVLPIG